jgi:hypothetical protein
MSETQQTETVTTTTTETVHEEQHADQNEKKSSLWSDILTIIGFAILFIIIIWGLVHLVELIASSLSPDFAKPAPTIQVSAPAQATSGVPVTISWNYTPSVAGSYAFLYECQTGLTFQMQEATSSYATIPCGVAYTTSSASSSVTLTPILSATSSVADTLSVVFIPQASGSQVQGNATMTVNAPVKPVPAPTPTKSVTTTTTYVAPKTSSYTSSSYTSTNYTGPAQLSVRVISGTINSNGDGTVTFDIANIGGSASGSYYFSAQLPTAQPYPYQSPLQASLAPGSHVTSTLNFTDAASGGGLFSVTIEGSAANSSSDYASMQITGPYNYNNNGYQEPYIQYPQYTY